MKHSLPALGLRFVRDLRSRAVALALFAASPRDGLLGVKGVEALANAARAGETEAPALSR